MQHSAYASADKSLKVLPRSGSQLQEIHPEPGHQFCPIWLLTNPWQLHVAVLASALEILCVTCNFMLVISQKSRCICIYIWVLLCILTAIWQKWECACMGGKIPVIGEHFKFYLLPWHLHLIAAEFSHITCAVWLLSQSNRWTINWKIFSQSCVVLRWGRQEGRQISHLISW